MKFSAVCIAASFLILFGGCAHKESAYHGVSYDYSVKYDFDRVKSYDWVSLPGTLRIDRFNRLRIKAVVDSELDARGLKIDQRNPDVFLVMYGGYRKEVDMSAMMDYKVYSVGRLKLALYDAKSNEEVWWAETRADAFHDMTPEEKDRAIAFAVHRIFEYYPPIP